MKPSLVIRSRRVVRGNQVGPATIHIHDGKIESVEGADAVPQGARLVDAGDAVVMPGIVDTHVHINEPGRTDWEGFDTGTRAAAAGGVTTLVEMPLNSIPATTSVEGLRVKLESAKGKLHVDVGFWGGVVPRNCPELKPLYDAGVWGFKCFLVPSGVEEFPCVNEEGLRSALPVLAENDALLLAHAEVPGPIDKAVTEMAGAAAANPRRHSTWLQSRPRKAEHDAIAMLIRLAREFGARVHVVHLSSADAIPLLDEAKAKGTRISAETCPHYLSFCAEEVPDGATEFKCAPPIRERENRERLWDALKGGIVDMVVTDHSPCPPKLKCRDSGDFLRAWGGITSLQLSLSVMWTQLYERALPICRLADWMCRAPATLAGLGARKGAIAPGFDADLVIWSPESTFRVDARRLHHRHKLTPYEGKVLRGVVETTILRGQIVFHKMDFPSGPVGEILLRTKP